MLKALIKKQFLSVITRVGVGKKSPLRGAAVLAVIFVFGGGVFFAMSYVLAVPYSEAGMGWLYFVYVSLMAMGLTVVGSVFMAQSCLYEAKDNELLLSLPIPTKYILFVRMLPLYAQALFFEGMALIPACICWSIFAPVTASAVVIWVLMLFIQPFFSLFLICAVGWLLSLITSRMRDKTLFTVILSILFLVAYFILYSKLMSSMTELISNSVEIGEGIKSGAYMLFMLGGAFMGSFADLAVMLAITAALFGGLYFALSKTYIRLVTDKHGGVKRKWDGRAEKARSPFTALLKKELRRFFGSGIYFLNSGLGVVMLFILTVFFAVRADGITSVLESLGLTGTAEQMPLIMTALVAFICMMDEVTAPSISLEGDTLWILQSTPVDLWSVLKAKLTLHYLVTAPAATVCSAVFAIMLRPSGGMAALMLILPSVTVAFPGVLGLIFDLKKPKLKWENETVVIKQSTSVLLTMLISWGALAVCIGITASLGAVIGTELALTVATVLLAGVTAALGLYLKKHGASMLAQL